jgi:anion-transporting  ArsA/GET3 family ATPase
MVDLMEDRRVGYSQAAPRFLHGGQPPPQRARAEPPAYDHPVPPQHVPLEQRLKGRRLLVCVGAGGVGKTTVSAALGLGLAARGGKVAVVSIDPARRLADALGVGELSGQPHRIPPRVLAEQGVELEGELWAMALDSKGTFDELVERLAPDDRARAEILSNRIYRELSSATAGSQEFTAVAKLFELDRQGRWDTIVLDTPPSRNALDFLDAPERLTRFLEGRALRVLLAPGAAARGLFGRGTGLMLSMFARATGVNMVGELSGFFGSLGSLIDGFRERARGVGQLLRDPATAFLIVTSPEPEPSREALFLHAELTREGLATAGVIVNRFHSEGLEGHTPEQVAALLAPALGGVLAARVADNLADFDVLARRDRASVRELTTTLGKRDPGLVDDPVLVGQLDGDVQDIGGLWLIAERLFA